MEQSSVGVEVIKETSGNHALKVYNQSECCEFDLRLGTDVNAPGSTN